jgi:hypothetical protein
MVRCLSAFSKCEMVVAQMCREIMKSVGGRPKYRDEVALAALKLRASGSHVTKCWALLMSWEL